jgi:two-component system NtrC family sensor kinase
MRLSLRTRLLGSFVAVILTCGAISTVVGVHMMGDRVISQAQDKVRLDLNSARVLYHKAVSEVRCAVRHNANRFFMRRALESGRLDSIRAELERVRRRDSLDVLTVVDASGRVLLRTRNPDSRGDLRTGSAVLARALSAKSVVASTELVGREELLRESRELARRAHVRLVPTPRARPSERTEETSGMMIKAAAPILDEKGDLLGALYGGRLLNRNFDLVDRIKDTVYQGETYAGRDIGTATIFQGDLRIATNVMDADGRRAIGTRLSAEVGDRVLGEGRRWVERAFVVNDWYITAYEPITDASGKVIGVLYVGMRERKFADMRRNTLMTFVGISLGGLVLSVGMCLLLSRALTGPTRALLVAAQRLAAGDLRQRVAPDESIAEIASLGHAFNSMAESIEERDEQLRQRAQEEIMKSERLAMIGRLAAGVAHEINNPLGGILLFSRLLLKKSSAEGVDRENLERIAREAERCQKIVQGLLEFARQREPKAERLDLNELIEKTLALVEGQALFHNIEIERRLARGLPPVRVDGSQMQQVFMNVIMNAAEAMDGRGKLTVTSEHDAASRRVEVSFADTGCGITEENLGRLFEPFFTTKEVGRGTGLGLSISHGIVERHGGSLRVASRAGQGATFTVSLPRAAEGN